MVCHSGRFYSLAQFAVYTAKVAPARGEPAPSVFGFSGSTRTSWALPSRTGRTTMGRMTGTSTRMKLRLKPVMWCFRPRWALSEPRDWWTILVETLIPASPNAIGLRLPVGAILPQFLTIEPHFVRKGCAGRLELALLLQFLTIEVYPLVNIEKTDAKNWSGKR